MQKKIVDRFKNKLSPPNRNGCIIFNGEILRNGYGRMCINYKKIVAHRIAWSIKNGEIPEKMCVLHKCDERKCVNVNHLFLGTNQDNIADKVNKNRQQKGDKIYTAKLNEKKVKTIKQLLLSNQYYQYEIARNYAVTTSAISHINTNRTWKYVGDI